MEQTDWAARWSDGEIGFHQAEISPYLTRYAEQVWGAGAWGRIYVPLCGKSLDMAFLAARADKILGVEYVEQAIEEFFAERELGPIVEHAPPRYSAANYTLFAADFFALTKAELGAIDGVFDRAALIALDPETRVRYAAPMRSLLRPGARTLLLTFDYDQSQMDGPPFAVSTEEVYRLYADGFKVEHLETRDANNERFRARGVTAMTNSAFVLTRL